MKIILLFVVLAILTSCAKKPPVGFEPYVDLPVYAEILPENILKGA